MKKITKFIAKVQLIFGATCLVVFVLATLVQVLSRYLGISMLWTEEVAVNAFIWAMFLGSAVMVREKQHFSFGVLSDKLTGVKKSILVIVQNIIMLIFCILCSIYSIEITDVFWNSKWITIPEFKQGYVWLALPITFITSSVYLVENIFDELKKFYWFKGFVWN
ncbi:TRAP transporter small permease [Vibrio scophthalmi]|uniref:TRAP transporter small permease protein n=1 Tax=Vibrio scophthalmi TaxID=45658 RepID=A0A1C7FHQ1_9VIBR|nr:TRAP transporter small permease [Vibrio scophthalmi]ANU38983.1 hypothetical protein VSVS05_03947 [Vibrio scophthalmi]